MHTIRYAILLASTALVLSSCQDAGENSTGSEYMPDMGHSVAFEANTYFDYYFNTWDSASVKKKYELAQPGTPVKGTIPRGFAGYYLAGAGNGGADLESQAASMSQVRGRDQLQAISTPINGSVPYYYVDTESDRKRAVSDLRGNPFPITVDGLKRGAELYNLFCAICHGENGGGNGWIYENGAYPAAPANFLQESWVDTSAGLYYHAMMYGKNVMGAYKDKVSYEERWQIIHHIRALQAKEFKMEYNEAQNNMNPNESEPIASASLFARSFYENISPEPIQLESQESDSPEIVGSPNPMERVQAGEKNPATAVDSTGRKPGSSTGTATPMGSERKDLK